MVNKVFLLFALSMLLVFNACEESDIPDEVTDLPVSLGAFNFVQYDTSYSGNEEFVVLHGDIISLSDSIQSISVTRVEHQKPAAWSSSFCVGPACLPPFLDRFTFTLEAGDTAAFSLDTYPNATVGEASWTIFAVDSTTMEVDSVHISMEYTGAL